MVVFLLRVISVFILLQLKISTVLGACYRIENVTAAGGVLLESPQWSVEENALYWVDNYGQKLFRMDGNTGEVTMRYVCYGLSSFIIPVRDHPGYVVVAIRSSLYILYWWAPGGDEAFRQLTTVDRGRPDNNINDGKADANGRLWFGTYGKLLLGSPRLVIPDQATLYSMDCCNYAEPLIQKRPVSLSNGIAWSLDNKKMYYCDSPTRRVTVFDYDLRKGKISNEAVLFDFDKYNISGIPDGITKDADGNLWVATFNGRKILVINPSGALLYQITLPVDQVSSVMWGGADLGTLYVTTGRLGVTNPMELSGAVFTITGLKTRGIPENQFVFPNAPNY